MGLLTMLKATVALTLLGAVATQVAVAQPAGRKWAQEPASVFGIALGQRIENDAFRECGGVQVQSAPAEVSVCALDKPKFGEGDVVISGIPISAFETGTVARVEGVVTAISLTAQHDRYLEIKSMLLERYGRPTSTRAERVQNLAGASFRSEVLHWIGSSVSLTLIERSSRVDSTQVAFTHNASMSAAGSNSTTRRKQDAAKF